MNKLILKANSFVGICNKAIEYTNAITSLPPRGENAKAQASEEVRQVFRQLNGQSKSLENSLIEAITGNKK